MMSVKNVFNSTTSETIILVAFCGAFTVTLGFSPIYITFALVSILLSLKLIKGIRVKQNKSGILMATGLIFYYLCIYSIRWDYKTSKPSALINLVFSLMYFIACLISFQNVSRKTICRALKYLIAVSLFFLTTESIYRLANPVDPVAWKVSREDIFWYRYKTSSFMYSDSNSVGLYIAILISLILVLPKPEFRILKKYLFWLFLLLFATLSRASIIATLILMVCRQATKSTTKFLLLLVGCGVLAFSSMEQIGGDESFLSKFWIFSLFTDYLNTASLGDILYGVGPGNSEKILGVGAHLIIILYVLEIGLIGSLLLLLLWCYIAAKSGWGGITLIILLIINGFSFSTFAVPSFYTFAAILMYYKRKELNASINSNACVQC